MTANVVQTHVCCMYTEPQMGFKHVPPFIIMHFRENRLHLPSEFRTNRNTSQSQRERSRKCVSSDHYGHKQYKQSQLNIIHFITPLVEHPLLGLDFYGFITFCFLQWCVFAFLLLFPQNVTTIPRMRHIQIVSLDLA